MPATQKTELRCDICGNSTFTSERYESIVNRSTRQLITGAPGWVVIAAVVSRTSPADTTHVMACSDQCHLAFAQAEAERALSGVKKGLDRVLDGDVHGLYTVGPLGTCYGDVIEPVVTRARELHGKDPSIWTTVERKLSA